MSVGGGLAAGRAAPLVRLGGRRGGGGRGGVAVQVGKEFQWSLHLSAIGMYPAGTEKGIMSTCTRREAF